MTGVTGVKNHEELEEQVKNTLEIKQGLILGEATAISTRVHAMDSQKPGIIRALSKDAGQFFYHRTKPHEIIHIDCFHELGELNHRMAADYLLEKMPTLITDYNLPEKMADSIDIQTGTGGGRLSGELIYGQKKTLKIAHNNHVHLAIKLKPAHYRAILPLIWYLEQAIIEQGFELRKILSLKIKPFKNQIEIGLKDSSMDYYSSSFDTNLKGRNKKGRMKPSKDGTGKVEELREISQELGTSETKKMMGQLFQGISKQNFLKLYSHNKQKSLLTKLKKKNVLKEHGKELQLTSYGEELREMMNKHLPEIEFKFRALARDIPNQKADPSFKKLMTRKGDSKQVEYKNGKDVVIPEPGEPLTELDVPETVIAAAKRNFIEKNRSLNIAQEDLRLVSKNKSTAMNMCFLIDASGSMGGKRMEEVKYLVEHVILTGRNKISVITFQEDKAQMEIPFTRSWYHLRKGLAQVRAFGLTPMAKGIEAGRKVLTKEGEGCQKNNTFLILITDGLPTISQGSEDPFRETLRAAQKMSQDGIKFICIGLEPNEKFLKQLTKVSGGSLYILNELEKESLAKIINREKETK